MAKPTEFKIANFAGLNVKDAADKVADNEFTLLQNVYQPQKGVFSLKFGSFFDFSSASFPLVSRVSGVWRHYASNGQNISLYHCLPDSTLLPDNTSDLVLTDITSTNGNLFGGGSVVTLRFCYSWIGRGMEQTYNSKNRSGYPTSFPVNAWSNSAHQSIFLGGTAHIVNVKVPAFPSGVVGANIFMARGTSTQMSYVGTVTTSGGTLGVAEYIGSNSASNDALVMSAPAVGAYNSQGTLTPGTYYVSAAWVVDPGIEEGSGTFPNYGNMPSLSSGLAFNAFFSRGTLGVSSATSGSLANATSYDFVVTLVDPNTGQETNVSPVFTVTTGVSATSIDILVPSLETLTSIYGGYGYTALSGSTYNIYIGNHSGTLYLAKSGISPGGTGYNSPTTNIGFVPTSGQNPPSARSSFLTYSTQVNLSGNQNSISISAPTLASTNGAQACYVFVGTQDPSVHPMTCVGIMRYSSSLHVLSIPTTNAQSAPYMYESDINDPFFWNGVNDGWIGGIDYSVGTRVQARFGFLLSNRSGLFEEIFPSRSLLWNVKNFLTTQIYSGDTGNSSSIHNFSPNIRTPNDRYDISGTYSQPFNWNATVTDPMFCYNLGISYFANGVDLPWQTDGYTLGQLCSTSGAPLLPPIPRFIFIYQNSLVISGALAGNQIYGSNANAPRNFATGGYGTALRFVSIGDPIGSGVSAQGIFTPATEATNNPNSFMIGFKKIGTWMINSIPDPTINTITGALNGQVPSTMVQVSGRTGCVAYRSIAQTPLGTVFLGQDGNVFLINAVREPQRIGTKIQPLLAHLVNNDAWARMCTALYHDNHYKLSYPSLYATTQSPVVCDSELWADLRTEGGEPIRWYGPHAGRNIGAQVVLNGDNDMQNRLCADQVLVQTYFADELSQLNELGAAIVAKITSKIYRGGADAHFKRILGAMVDAYLDSSYTNNLLLELFVDELYVDINRNISNGAAVWDGSTWNAATWGDAFFQDYSMLLEDSSMNGRVFQWSLTKSDQSPFSLAGVTLILKPENRRIIA